jgi:hypothetical protein
MKPVTVAIVTPTADFVDQAQQDRLDTSKDLRESLGGRKKVMQLVEDPSVATLVLEVLGRGVEVGDTSRASR